MAKKERFSDQLRRAVETSDKTRYRISKETGIAQSILSRFVNEGAGVSMESIDKLVECLGLRLVADERGEKKGR
jgi:DNA-binding phage protein